MIILHANWTNGRLWTWCEGMVAEDAQKADPARNPFSQTGAAFAYVARALCGARRPSLRARHVRDAKAMLPVYEGRPVPSRIYLLPTDWPAPPENFLCDGETAAFAVSALPLSFVETATLFSRVVSAPAPEKSLTDNAVAGDDLISLARLWKFAAAAVSRGAALPAIEGERSRWLPVLDAADSARLAALVDTVPPSAYCIDGASPPRAFFGDIFDRLVRYASSSPLSRLHARKASFNSLHSAWLSSLRAPNSRIRWQSQDEIAALSRQLADWRLPAERVEDSAAALGFRITDPVDPDARNPRWALHPVAIVNGEALPLVPKTFAALPPGSARRLLLSLGQASEIVPLLPRDSLSTSSSGASVGLDAAALSTFLKEDAPVLRASGYLVLAPPWWPSSRHASRPTVRAVSAVFRKASGLFSLDSLLDVKWEVVLGDTTLTAQDIEWILSKGDKIVRFGDRWVPVDAKELRAARDKLRALSSAPVKLRDLVQLGIGAGAAAGGVQIEIANGVIPERADVCGLTRILDGAGKLMRVDVPKGFSGTLREYQRRGLDWLSFLHGWGFGACLADDMGLGKTVEAIAAFLDSRAKGAAGPVLVVCPMSIMIKWTREIARFAPALKTWIYHGPARPKGAAYAKEAARHDVCVTSYQMLCAEYAAIKAVHWSIVLLDEAQNIKNPRTDKSKAARSLNADWRVALTGTPVENSVGDLWAIMDFLNPGLLLGQSDFAERFLRPIATGSDPEARNELRRITAPFILRRLKSDPEIVAGLPPKVEEKVYCTLTEEQAELYAAEVRDAEHGIAGRRGIARHGAVLALLTKLKQICNHPAHYLKVDGLDDEDLDEETPAPAPKRGAKRPAEGAPKGGRRGKKAAKAAEGPGRVSAERSGKLARLDEMLAEVIGAGECALVFTQYATMGRMLADHLSEKFGFEVPFLHGGVPMNRRDELVSRFQRADGPPVFVLSIKAGGTGLDLTRANHVFHYDRWWNPAIENQATDRAHRIGQGKTVFVHTMICEGTLESHIDDLLTSKLELAEKIIASGDSWLTSLDDTKLRKVVALSSSGF